MDGIRLAAVVLAGCALGACGASASTAPRHSSVEPLPAPSDGELVRALERRLTVWTKPDGTPVFARSCRNGPVDCRERIAVLAALIEETATRNELDPWLFAALAVRESGLNPSAIGARGEAGIVQLHPRGVGQGVRYVEDADYREQCQQRVDACQRPVLEKGARALRDAIHDCGGVIAGLGKYASGRCLPGASYIDGVIEERDRLRQLAD